MKEIEVGNIYLYQNEYIADVVRVLCFDSEQVLIESWLEHSQAWNKVIHKTCIFERSSMVIFIKFTTFYQSSKFSLEELAKIRPDLPLKIGVDSSCRWSFPPNIFSENLDSFYADENTMLEISKICLFTLGKKGGIKSKRHYIESENGFLTEKYIMQKAYEIVNTFSNFEQKGIGLVRMGYNNAIPSYIVKESLE